MSSESLEENSPEPSSTPQANGSAPAPSANNKPILLGLGGIAIVAILGFLCVLCLLIVLLTRQFFFDDTPLVATETAVPTPTALTTIATSEPQVVGVSNSGTISVTLGTPVLLRLAGQEYDLLTDPIGADGVWKPTVRGEGQAAWVRGTVVNYVIGLPYNSQNETLLSQLTPGQEIQLTTNGRTHFTFTFAERTMLSVNDRSVYAQQTPGITLILLGPDGSERLVVRGIAQSSEADNSPQNMVEIGHTAQLDNFQITTNSAIYISDRAEIPSGFSFFQVEYAIQNVGLTAVDTSNLDMTLLDDLGNRYALNPLASQSGNYPVLNGFLNANQTTTAVAGYQMPVGLNSETVRWVVTNRETGAQLFVSLPFTGGATAVQAASSSLFRAEVSTDLTSLNLGGQITNLGTQPLVITESDIRLSTPDGAIYLLLSTNPPLPWTVTAGQTVQFFLTYQRPSGGNALFRVLNQEFQITEQP